MRMLIIDVAINENQLLQLAISQTIM